MDILHVTLSNNVICTVITMLRVATHILGTLPLHTFHTRHVVFITHTGTNWLYINLVCSIAVAFHLGSDAFIALIAFHGNVD